MIRLKMLIQTVKHVVAQDGMKTQEEIEAFAVYGPDGSPNGQWSKWTPSAKLSITISNPDAFGKILPGQYVFVDLTTTTKEAI